MNQMNDDAMRELRSLTDKVKARIYGQNSAAIKYDWLTGESTDTPEYLLGFVRQKKVDSGEHQAAKVYSELRKLDHALLDLTRNLETSLCHQRFPTVQPAIRHCKRSRP